MTGGRQGVKCAVAFGNVCHGRVGDYARQFHEASLAVDVRFRGNQIRKLQRSFFQLGGQRFHRARHAQNMARPGVTAAHAQFLGSLEATDKLAGDSLVGDPNQRVEIPVFDPHPIGRRRFLAAAALSHEIELCKKAIEGCSAALRHLAVHRRENRLRDRRLCEPGQPRVERP